MADRNSLNCRDKNGNGRYGTRWWESQSLGDFYAFGERRTRNCTAGRSGIEESAHETGELERSHVYVQDGTTTKAV
jgi:hypothetical protein